MVEKKLENLGLDSYRQELDLIDEDLKRLLNKRAKIALNIAKNTDVDQSTLKKNG